MRYAGFILPKKKDVRMKEHPTMLMKTKERQEDLVARTGLFASPRCKITVAGS
jgi:hypothetical protein